MSAGKWIPLECNPEVFNSWAKKAGLVTSQACFGDVYGLDEELLSMVPQPVKALILIFPLTGQIKAKHDEEDEKLKKEGGTPVDPTVMWIKQTISNACGTMALIHSLANSDVTIAPHSPLYKFIDQCKDKTPEERAHLLETTTLFSEIHADTASEGQSTVTEEIMNTNLHFAAFVAAPEPDLRRKASTGEGVASVATSAEGLAGENKGATEKAAAVTAGQTKASSGMRLIELDGTRVGPLDRGECNDLLADAARYIREHYISTSSSVQFSMLALGPPA